jgi:hypothetical protein
MVPQILQEIFSVEKKFRESVTVDEIVVKMRVLRAYGAYVWSDVDVDFRENAGNLRFMEQEHTKCYEVP